jgi:hypothetical protein
MAIQNVARMLRFGSRKLTRAAFRISPRTIINAEKRDQTSSIGVAPP